MHDTPPRLISGYHDACQLLFVSDQLAHARTLLRNGSERHARLALILAQSLAEQLLERFDNGRVRACQGRGLERGRVYTRDRSKIRASILGPVAVATRSRPRPLLDRDDEAVLRMARRHRNGSGSVARLLGRLALVVVCRMLEATTPAVTIAVLGDEDWLTRLRRYGLAQPAPGRPNAVSLPDAAVVLTRGFLGDLAVTLPEVQAALADDLLGRVERAVEATVPPLGASGASHSGGEPEHGGSRPVARVFAESDSLADVLERYGQLDRELHAIESVLPTAIEACQRELREGPERPSQDSDSPIGSR